MNNAVEAKIDEFSGQCVVCDRPTTFACERCWDFYCSLQCQKKDWPRHRYCCFPMPSLVTTRVTNAMTQQQIVGTAQPVNNDVTNHDNNKPKAVMPSSKFPKSNSRVVLTGFRAPKRCFVRSTSPEDEESYINVLQKVDTYGKSAPPLLPLPRLKSYAIAEENGTWYRVRISLVRKCGEVKIGFCDRGWTKYRYVDKLRQINEETIRLPKYPAMVQLRNVSEFKCTQKVIDKLAHFEGQEFKLTIDEKDGSVELFFWPNGRSLNDEIERIFKELQVPVVKEEPAMQPKSKRI